MEPTGEFFHQSKTPLEPGTVLEPRFIRPELKYQFDVVGSAFQEPPEIRAVILKAVLLSDIVSRAGKPSMTFPVKETVLEHIRRTEFPQRLSRHSAIFLSPTKQDARAFRDAVNDRPYLYTCVVNGEFFTGDIRYVSSPNPYAPMLKQIEYLLDQARRYWDGQKSEAPILECLANPGAVTVVRPSEW